MLELHFCNVFLKQLIKKDSDESPDVYQQNISIQLRRILYNKWKKLVENILLGS